MKKIFMFLINEIEGAQMTGETEPEKMLARMIETYPEAKTVLTLGGQGAVYQEKGKKFYQPVYKVKAVDTTGAGDTFTGYLVASLVEGAPVEKGMDLAAKAAAIAVTRKGAAPSIPYREEVEDYSFSDF